MASTSEQGRVEQLRIRREAAEQMLEVFPALDFTRIDATAGAWMLAVESITGKAHKRIGAVAEEAYFAERRAAGATGNVTFVVPPLDVDKLRRSLLTLGPYAAKHALSGGGQVKDVAAIVFSNTSGSALRDAMKAGRDGVRATTLRDRRAVGWRRIARAGACKFCRMAADKGAVYREATAYFSAHNHCSCTAAPAFLGGEIGPEANVMQYLGARRTRTAAEKATLRDWLNEQYPD
jgi:hypothetical protein